MTNKEKIELKEKVEKKIGEEAKYSGEGLKKTLGEISQYAEKLYNLMQPGMVIDISLPEQKIVVVPGQPPKAKRLLITRPHLHLSLKATHR